MELCLGPRYSTESDEYWEKILKHADNSENDRYGTYLDLSAFLHKYIRPTDRTLALGLGSHYLSEELRKAGYQSLDHISGATQTDGRQQEDDDGSRHWLEFLKSNESQLPFEDISLNAVIERGVLESVRDGGEPTGLAHFVREIHRILKIGGRYLGISLGKKGVLVALLKCFTDNGWLVRLHKITREIPKTSTVPQDTRHVPLFGLVCTKLRNLPGVKMPLEICTSENSPPVRVNSLETVVTAFEECRYYAMVQHQLRDRKANDDEIAVQLFSSLSGDRCPRYTLHIIDVASHNGDVTKMFAIFITPEGRETEWLFGTDKGRRKLSAVSGFQRLVVVSLHRDQTYRNMAAIQDELSPTVMKLAPAGCDPDVKVPFLSAGDDICCRANVHRGTSQLTGDFVVEDIVGEHGHTYRTLVFLRNHTQVQSQARLKRQDVETSKKTRRKQKARASSTKPLLIDHSYLDFGIHKHMVACLSAVPRFTEPSPGEIMRILVVGLGAGMLPMFLHRHFPKVCVHAVELDEAVAGVAKQWFGLVEDERLKVYVEDGLQYIARLASGADRVTYNAILFDANAGEGSTGLRAPPRAFIGREFLRKVHSLLCPQGVLMINIISYDDATKQGVTDEVKTVFPVVLTKSVEDEVNDLLLAIAWENEETDTERAREPSLVTDDCKRSSHLSLCCGNPCQHSADNEKSTAAASSSSSAAAAAAAAAAASTTLSAAETSSASSEASSAPVSTSAVASAPVSTSAASSAPVSTSADSTTLSAAASSAAASSSAAAAAAASTTLSAAETSSAPSEASSAPVSTSASAPVSTSAASSAPVSTSADSTTLSAASSSSEAVSAPVSASSSTTLSAAASVVGSSSSQRRDSVQSQLLSRLPELGRRLQEMVQPSNLEMNIVDILANLKIT